MQQTSKESRRAELDAWKARQEEEALAKLKRLGLEPASDEERAAPEPVLWPKLPSSGWDPDNPSPACLKLTQLPDIAPELESSLTEVDKEGILWRTLFFELEWYFRRGKAHELLAEARRAANIFVLWRRGVQSLEGYDSIDAERLMCDLEFWYTFKLSPSIRRLDRCEGLYRRIVEGKVKLRDRGKSDEQVVRDFADRWMDDCRLGLAAQEALFSRLHLYLEDEKLRAVMHAILHEHNYRDILQGDVTPHMLLVQLMFMGALADSPGREIVVAGPDGESKIQAWTLIDALRSTFGDLRNRRVGKVSVWGKAGTEDVRVEDEAPAPDDVADAVDQRDENDAYLALIDSLDAAPGSPDAAYCDFLKAFLTGDRGLCPVSALAEEKGFPEATMRGARQRIAEKLARRVGGAD